MQRGWGSSPMLTPVIPQRRSHTGPRPVCAQIKKLVSSLHDKRKRVGAPSLRHRRPQRNPQQPGSGVHTRRGKSSPRKTHLAHSDPPMQPQRRKLRPIENTSLVGSPSLLMPCSSYRPAGPRASALVLFPV